MKYINVTKKEANLNLLKSVPNNLEVINGEYKGIQPPAVVKEDYLGNVLNVYNTLENYNLSLLPFEELKAEKQKQRLIKKQSEYDVLMDEYDPFEKETFNARKDEAIAWMQDNTNPTPFINASLSNYTAEQRIEEINAVYQKALSIATLSGISRNLRHAIESIVVENYASEADAIAALEAIEF